MNRNKIKHYISEVFNKKVLVIVYYDGNYYFGLENDKDLDYTMNIRYINARTNEIGLFNGMDDISLYKRLQALVNEENLL